MAERRRAVVPTASEREQRQWAAEQATFDIRWPEGYNIFNAFITEDRFRPPENLAPSARGAKEVVVREARPRYPKPQRYVPDEVDPSTLGTVEDYFRRFLAGEPVLQGLTPAAEPRVISGQRATWQSQKPPSVPTRSSMGGKKKTKKKGAQPDVSEWAECVVNTADPTISFVPWATYKLIPPVSITQSNKPESFKYADYTQVIDMSGDNNNCLFNAIAFGINNACRLYSNTLSGYCKDFPEFTAQMLRNHCANTIRDTVEGEKGVRYWKYEYYRFIEPLRVYFNARYATKIPDIAPDASNEFDIRVAIANAIIGPIMGEDSMIDILVRLYSGLSVCIMDTQHLDDPALLFATHKLTAKDITEARWETLIREMQKYLRDHTGNPTPYGQMIHLVTKEFWIDFNADLDSGNMRDFTKNQAYAKLVKDANLTPEGDRILKLLLNLFWLETYRMGIKPQYLAVTNIIDNRDQELGHATFWDGAKITLFLAHLPNHWVVIGFKYFEIDKRQPKCVVVLDDDRRNPAHDLLKWYVNSSSRESNSYFKSLTPDQKAAIPIPVMPEGVKIGVPVKLTEDVTLPTAAASSELQPMSDETLQALKEATAGLEVPPSPRQTPPRPITLEQQKSLMKLAGSEAFKEAAGARSVTKGKTTRKTREEEVENPEGMGQTGTEKVGAKKKRPSEGAGGAAQQKPTP